MNRIEIFRIIPQEARDIIRANIAHREDALINDISESGRKQLVECCEEMIHGLLSLYYNGKRLERAYRVLLS